MKKLFSLKSIFNILLLKQKYLYIGILFGGTVAYVATFLIGENYEVTAIFQQSVNTPYQVNEVRFDLLGNKEWSKRIIGQTDENTKISSLEFRQRTILVHQGDGSVYLLQTFQTAKMAEEISRLTVELVEQETGWTIQSVNPVQMRKVARARIVAIGMLLGLFGGSLFIISQRSYILKFSNDGLRTLQKEGMVEIRMVTPLFFIIKRIIDVFLGCLGLIPFAVVYCFLYVPYMVGKNRGPLLFKQKRYGLHGEYFYIYKFRSMRTNAENVLKSDKLLWQKYVANGYKLLPKEDPRTTKLGKFIRKTSLDELPQFINVVKGDMSFIGPRPIISEELAEYGNRSKYFLAMKPGITGVWAISGRNNLAYPERCDAELSYLAKRSIAYDFYVILQTVIGVLKREGAY